MRLLTRPAVEPLTLQELRQHTRVLQDADGSSLMRMLRAARETVENWLNRSLIDQKWEMSFDGSPYGQAIELWRSPIKTVDAVKSYSEANTEVVYGSTNYFLDLGGSRLALSTGAIWPVGLRGLRSFVVEYTAGYGADGSSVPETIRHAICMVTAHLWENREATAEKSVEEIPIGVKDILSSYKAYT